MGYSVYNIFKQEVSITVIILTICLKAFVGYLIRSEQAWTLVLRLWDATVEINSPVLTHRSAMSSLFVSSQTGLPVLKASTSNMNQVSMQVLFYLLNKIHFVILHVAMTTNFFITESILLDYDFMRLFLSGNIKIDLVVIS